MLHDTVIASIRTFIPAAVGAIIAFIVSLGVPVPEGFEVMLNGILFGLATTAYYTVVTFLERKVHPAFGWLLGAPKVPAYTKKNVTLAA